MTFFFYLRDTITSLAAIRAGLDRGEWRIKGTEGEKTHESTKIIELVSENAIRDDEGDDAKSGDARRRESREMNRGNELLILNGSR